MYQDAGRAVAEMLGGYFDYPRARAQLLMLSGERISLCDPAAARAGPVCRCFATPRPSDACSFRGCLLPRNRPFRGTVPPVVAPAPRRRGTSSEPCADVAGKAGKGGSDSDATIDADGAGDVQGAPAALPSVWAPMEEYARAIRQQVALRIAAAAAAERSRRDSAVDRLHAGVPAKGDRSRGATQHRGPTSRIAALAAEHEEHARREEMQDRLGRPSRGKAPAHVGQPTERARSAPGGEKAGSRSPTVRRAAWSARGVPGKRTSSTEAVAQAGRIAKDQPGVRKGPAPQAKPKSRPVVAFGSRVEAPLPQPPEGARYKIVPKHGAWLPRVATLQRQKPSVAVYEVSRACSDDLLT